MNKKKAKKIIIICIVVVLVLSAAAVGGAVLLKNRGGPVGVFSLYDVGMTDYIGDQSECSGMVSTENMQSVYISPTQTLKEVYVQEGQQVSAGDKLASFDTTLSDVELERQRIAVEKVKAQITEETAHLAEINTYKPYVPVPEPEPEPEKPLEPVTLPYLRGGDGTQGKPYIYLWDASLWYTEDFINTVIPLEPVNPAPPEEPENPEEGDPGESTGESGDEPGDTEPDAPPAEETVYVSKTAYVIFEEREYSNPEGELLEYWGMVFTRNTDGSFVFSVYKPDPSYDAGSQPDTPSDPGVSPEEPQYTAAEIAQMRAESEKKIKDLNLQLKVEQVKYEKLKLEINTGVVTAEVSGIVKSVSDPAEAKANGSSFILVSGGGGYYIEGTLTEMDLATVKVGQEVTVMSWYTGMEITGEIVEISDFPSPDSAGNYSNGNRNVSYYPFTVFVSDEADFGSEDYYVSIMYSSKGESHGIYVEKPFVLTEGSKSYLYVAGEDGKLHKREVTVGGYLWDNYAEIVSGITAEDRIAFPYGDNVRDGAEIKDGSLEELYS